MRRMTHTETLAAKSRSVGYGYEDNGGGDAQQDGEFVVTQSCWPHTMVIPCACLCSCRPAHHPAGALQAKGAAQWAGLPTAEGAQHTVGPGRAAGGMAACQQARGSSCRQLSWHTAGGCERDGLALAIGLPTASAVQTPCACATLLVAASRAIGARQQLTMQWLHIFHPQQPSMRL